jgi:two-component system, OmpR family, alkaline phosphatase synthesis response regulator PhoP
MKNILICDDVTDNCIFLQFFLELEGYKAEFVTSGIDAINKVRLAKPDLLLLDVMMPGISGLEVVKLIRQDDCLQNLSIVLVTAYHQSLEPQLTNVSVDGIIHKPVDPDLLIEQVHEILHDAVND